MKKIALTLMLVLITLFSSNVFGQVTIGSLDPPDPSAILELKPSTHLGLLLPRVPLTGITDVITIPNPATGLVVYNTGTVSTFPEAGFVYWDGEQWSKLGGAGGPWMLAGTTDFAADNNEDPIFQTGMVTIGLDSVIPSAILNVHSTEQGVLVPRMTGDERDAIADPVNGLLIYNIDEDCFNYFGEEEDRWLSLCGGNAHSEINIIDCANDIKVYGLYESGTPLSGGNYISVDINVTKPGPFTILIEADPDNGYFFYYAGEIFSPGPFNIRLPGMGTPVNFGIDHFTVILNGKAENGPGNPPCELDIEVLDSSIRPEYRMACSSIDLQGVYYEEESLDYSHYIELVLEVDPSSLGANWEIHTNQVDGIMFSGSGVLNSSPTQVVRLYGEGTPFDTRDKNLYLQSNSESSTANCQVTVYMVIPPKRVLGLGNMTSAFGYNPAARTSRSPLNSFNAMLTDENNYGPHPWSIVKYAGLKNATTGTQYFENFIPTAQVNSWVDDNRDIIGLDVDRWRAMTAATLESLLKGTNRERKVDIVVVGYLIEFFRNANADDLAKCQLLVDWVKDGGIMLMYSEQVETNGNFMNLFFNGATSANTPAADRIGSAAGAGAGSNYTLGFNSSNTPADMRPYYCRDDDPILRGPFEDILGRNWGEDASTTMYVTNLPLEEVVIYSGARPIGSTAQPANGVTIFRHRDYPFIFCGDGGFNSGNVRNYTTADNICPFQLTVKNMNGKIYNNYPNVRINFGGAGNRVYNTSFTANAFAWCIEKAEEIRKSKR